MAKGLIAVSHLTVKVVAKASHCFPAATKLYSGLSTAFYEVEEGSLQ
jgi:hypothetical protein